MTGMRKHREEIYDILTRSFGSVTNPNTRSFVARKIELYFLNEIKDLEEWSNSTPQKKIDNAIKNKELDPEYYKALKDGFSEALKLLRKRY